MSERVDNLIIGGGPSGAALAVELAQAGRRVLVLEREPGAHDKVCGEFISHEAAGYLARLGVDLVAQGAVGIDQVRLIAGTRTAATPLPFAAYSLSRRRLDEALLERAATAGALVRRGVRARALHPETGGWACTLADGGAVWAEQAFLAVGKHDLPGWKRESGLQGDLVGFKMHWRLSGAQHRALARHVELYLFPGGYAGLEPIEDGKANLCLLVRRGALPPAPVWPALVARMTAACPTLATRLTDATACWPRPLAITAIPYGHVADRADGVWRLGDQAAVIPSFAGDGMAIALHSARLAAQTHLAGGGPEAYQRRMARDVAGQVRAATWLSLAMVRPMGQGLMAAAPSLAPRLIALTAKRTRIADHHLDPAVFAAPPASGRL